MPRLVEPRWILLLSFSEKQLGQTIEFLREGNRILRDRLPDRITVTKTERNRLLKYGSVLGSAINGIITIVSPRTFARWKNAEPETRAKSKSERKPGRPKTEESVRDPVIRLAKENSWSYTRILGELKKLGIMNVSRTTVRNILEEAGIDPGPKRGQGTWSDFLTRHAKTMWA